MTLRFIILLALVIFGLGLIIRFNSYGIEASRNIERMREKVRKISIQNDRLKKEIIFAARTADKPENGKRK